MREEQKKVDICVIGGGPGGYVAAIKAAQLGAKTCLIERKHLGGTCLNVGCIPTKALLKSTEVLDTIRNMNQYGVTGSSALEVAGLSLDMEIVQGRKNRIVKQLVSGVAGLLRQNGVEVIEGAGVFADPNTIWVNKSQISAKNVIIATGSQSKNLDVPVSGKMILYKSEDILNLVTIPERIAVIGGGVIGVELACFLARAGAKVTIIEFLDQILPMVDREIAQLAEQNLRKEGIKIYTSAKVREIGDSGVAFLGKEGIVQVPCNAVLMAVGREPCCTGLQLEQAGVLVEKGAIVTDERMRTNVRNLYAVGDVNGKSMLAHTASAEGITAVENIMGKSSKMEYDRIPSGIYIQPEVAAVGLTEEQARRDYGDIRVGRFPLIGNGKAQIEGVSGGLIKIITEAKHGEILGAHIIAPHAVEMIAEICTAMQLEGTAEEMTKVVHPHPSISEAIQEAFHGAFGKAIHY